MERSTTELTGRLAEYARLAEQMRAVREGIDDIRATAYSDDGLISAVVGGRGELRELELDPRIYREQDATALASRIVATIRDAAAEAERDAVTFAQELLPPNRRGDPVDPMFDPALHALSSISALEGRK